MSSEAESSGIIRVKDGKTLGGVFSFASNLRRRQTSISASASSDSIQALSKMISKITLKDIQGAKPCGAGSFGTVWVVEDSLKRKVALKQLRLAGQQGADDIRRRALREGNTWRGLKHPNVLPFLGILETTSDLYLISPFAANGSLSEYIGHHPEADRETLLWEAALAIAFLHEHGIIHGDIKASNILVSHDIHALVCDFGLTRPEANATSAGLQGVGTIRCQSPELLAQDSGKTFASDVWAFGMTIYEVLSGRIPFHDLNVPSMIHAVAIEDKRPPTTPIHSSSGLPYDRTWSVAEGCWQRNPELRLPMKHVCRQLRPCMVQLKGHKQSVSCLAFSPGGHTLVLGSIDCTLRLWNVESASQKGEALDGHSKVVSCLAFSSDGRTLASGSYDRTLGLWDVESGSRKGKTLEGHSDWVRCLGFSPDAKKIASGSDDRTVRLWDVEAGRQYGEVLDGHTRLVNCLAWSSEGRMVASGSFDSTLRLWDIRSGRQGCKVLEGHGAEVWCLAFSPDGNTIASGSSDRTVRLWDMRSAIQEHHALEGHSDCVRCLAFSPDGRTIASGSRDHTLRLWDVQSGSQRGEALKGHTDHVNCLAFSPDSRTVASGSSDGTLRRWDVESGSERGGLSEGPHGSTVLSVAFSPDGTTIASGSSDSVVRLWDAT